MSYTQIGKYKSSYCGRLSYTFLVKHSTRYTYFQKLIARDVQQEAHRILLPSSFSRPQEEQEPVLMFLLCASNTPKEQPGLQGTTGSPDQEGWTQPATATGAHPCARQAIAFETFRMLRPRKGNACCYTTFVQHTTDV